MRKILTAVLLTVICIDSYSQDLPTDPAEGFAFPLGSRFTLALHPVDSVNFHISVTEFEPFHDIVDAMYGKDTLFPEKAADNLIICYFCLGTHGETDEDRERNMRILLIAKNYSRYPLEYSSDISRTEEGEKFESTSNAGMFPGAISTEIWHEMIYHIGLSQFRKFGAGNLRIIDPE